MTTKYVQAPEMTLQSSISSSATSCVVTGAFDLAGVPLVQTDFGDLGYGTFEPNTPREEAVAFVITSNPSGNATLTLTRGLRGKAPYGAGGASFTHNAGVKFVISNNPDLLNKLTAKDNDEVIEGSWSFPETPILDTNPVTKGHYDDTAVKLTGAQSVAGVKTFTDSPIVPIADADGEAVNKGQMESYAGALDAANVKLTGNQTVAGIKTFSTPPVVPDAVNPNQPLTKGQFDAATQEAVTRATEVLYGSVRLTDAPSAALTPIAVSQSSLRDTTNRNATPALDAGKVPRLESDGFLDGTFVREKLPLTTFDPFNFTSVPVPVFVHSDGTVIVSSAAAGSSRQDFNGFVKNINTAELLPRYIGGATSGSSTFSLTVPAGTNRVLLVVNYLTNSPITAASAMTWNGTSMTLLTDTGTAQTRATVFRLYLGTGPEVTANVVVTGASSAGENSNNAVVYENVHQTLGLNNTQSASLVAVTSVSTPTITAIDNFSLFVYGGVAGAATFNLQTSGTTQRQGGTRHKTGEFSRLLSNATADASQSSSTGLSVWGTVLRSPAAINVNLELNRLINGFTGLTPGANYFVSNTVGQISTTPGTLSLPVGTALNSTTLLVN